MQADLSFLKRFSSDLGFECKIIDDSILEITIMDQIVLIIKNYDRDDSLIAFKNSPWHAHDQLSFSNAYGFYETFDYIQIIEGIKTGKILIADEIENEELIERYPIHETLFDGFKYLNNDRELRVRKA